jgi:hypothetical protein
MGFPGYRAPFGRVGTLPTHCYEAGEGRDVPGATLRGGIRACPGALAPLRAFAARHPEGIAKSGA